MKDYSNIKTPGIPDEQFIRGDVPMTKEEIRVVTISKLQIKEEDIVIDIGAGTGSITIECGRLLSKGKVYAIEKNPKAIRLININKEKFELDNIHVLEGQATEVLPNITMFNKVVIGGSGGYMEDIIQWVYDNIQDKGKIVVNTITLENTTIALKALKKNGYRNIDVTQLNCAKGRFIGDLTLMNSYNPVYIISAKK